METATILSLNPQLPPVIKIPAADIKPGEQLLQNQLIMINSERLRIEGNQIKILGENYPTLLKDLFSAYEEPGSSITFTKKPRQPLPGAHFANVFEHVYKFILEFKNLEQTAREKFKEVAKQISIYAQNVLDQAILALGSDKDLIKRVEDLKEKFQT